MARISFTIPDKYAEDLKTRIPEDVRLSDFFKACAINRFIQIGICDEFGYPIAFPKLDFSFNGINLNELRETVSTTKFMEKMPRSTFNLNKEVK